jgi:hypothetical protein
MGSNLQELDYLYGQIALVEIIDRTTNCALIWTQTEQGVFQAEWVFEGVQYDLNLVYIPGNYLLDFIRDGEVAFSTSTNKDETVWELVHLLDNPNSPIREAIVALRAQRGCDAIFDNLGRGGVRVAGRSKISHVINITQLVGGVQAAGSAFVQSGIVGHGGAQLGGTAANSTTQNETSRGGIVVANPTPLLFAVPFATKGLYQFNTLGQNVRNISAGKPMGFVNGNMVSNSTVVAFDVDVTNQKLYLGIVVPYPLGNTNYTQYQVWRTDMNVNNPEFIVEDGTLIPPTLPINNFFTPGIRYDHYDNLLWWTDMIQDTSPALVGRTIYRYNLTTQTQTMLVEVPNGQNEPMDIAVFSNAVYTLTFPNLVATITRYSKTGTFISSVDMRATFNMVPFGIAENTDGTIFVCGQHNTGPNTTIVGKLSADLLTFTNMQTNMDVNPIQGVALDDVNDIVYATAQGTSSTTNRIHRFPRTGGVSTLAGIANLGSFYGLRINSH